MATSGLAVVLSGMTVIASLTAMYLINTPALKSMATGAILAVAVAMRTAATLTPVVLAMFGRSAAKRSALLHWSRQPESTQSRFWTRWVGWAIAGRDPRFGRVGLLLAMAVPAASMVLGSSLLRQFDSSHEIRDGVAAATQALGPGARAGAGAGHVSRRRGVQSPTTAEMLAAIRPADGAGAHVASVGTAAVSRRQRQRAAVRGVVDRSGGPGPLARPSTGCGTELPVVPGMPRGKWPKWNVGGPTALIKDFDERVSSTVPLVLLFVAVIAFVMLSISIHSVFLAFKGVLMTLSVAAAYGSLVMVFQWGWLDSSGFLSFPGQFDRQHRSPRWCWR